MSGIAVDLVQVVMFLSRFILALDAALWTRDELEFWTDLGSLESVVWIEFWGKKGVNCDES